MLPKMLPPMDAEALKAVLADYQAFIDRERKRQLESYANLTPKTTDVKPLYLAQVDPIDNEAVVELIALVPKTKSTTELRAFVRRNGTWELDNKMMTKIRSITPPPLVVLDDTDAQGGPGPGRLLLQGEGSQGRGGRLDSAQRYRERSSEPVDRGRDAAPGRCTGAAGR